MVRLDFVPDFEFNLVRVAWVVLFIGLLYWGHSLKREEAPVAMEPAAATTALAR